ncbi:hypothetical protein MPTK1_1g14990 [Marchantia polymorpha subsp. ruderalis]|uniref:C2 domain-containing protein n=2 Tax=Marchantia polymorpha TaxID=3197 RepID=A0AAF6AQB4_MARPO|nr:hypothetical protein MARPO_0033s0162 [Marchantia polymorpha]BBM98634.1 hypothetical protein Mp_1g14990 [Marchantia polymorpha subsp. ruderalis]|eukprot:PTQ41775.1 hypothetical protein MARPO_0033s0162 [Marchantia polymorpha]
MVAETFDHLREMKPKMRAGELIIRLKRARHIKGHEFMCFGKANVFALLTIGGEKRKSKVITNGGTNPVFEEQLSFKIAEHVQFSLYSVMYLHLYDHDLRKDKLRGTVKIEVADLLQANQNDVPIQMFQVMHKDKPRGTVELGLTFIPSNRKAGALIKSP